VIADALARELDLWVAQGRRATLWLRDDDACGDSPALARLLTLARTHAVPVAIAAIPAALEPTLAAALEGCREATVVQHGFAHRNHAPAGERSAELFEGRDVRVCIGELRRGKERLERTFGDRFVPIVVPPWNRAGEKLVTHLGAVGFTGLSRFGPRAGVPDEQVVERAGVLVDLPWVLADQMRCDRFVNVSLDGERTDTGLAQAG